MVHNRRKAVIMIGLSILGGIAFAFAFHTIAAGTENKNVNNDNNAAALAGY